MIDCGQENDDAKLVDDFYKERKQIAAIVARRETKMQDIIRGCLVYHFGNRGLTSLAFCRAKIEYQASLNALTQESQQTVVLAQRQEQAALVHKKDKVTVGQYRVMAPRGCRVTQVA